MCPGDLPQAGNPVQHLISWGESIEVSIITRGRIYLKVRGGAGVKKSGFRKDKWSKIEIRYTSGQIKLAIDGCIRITLEHTIESLEVLFFNTPIMLGGHLVENNKCKSINLFQGLIKGLKLILNPEEHISKIIEESKSEEIPMEPPCLMEKFEFLHSLYELAKFDPRQWQLHKATVPLQSRPPRVSRGHKTSSSFYRTRKCLYVTTSLQGYARTNTLKVYSVIVSKGKRKEIIVYSRECP